ncbi:MAG: esterase-like activity of phytase family protein [Campylobacterales bacterium]|nr:esterase-like activity of phytase family protein [Campylobacterales bacterium]
MRKSINELLIALATLIVLVGCQESTFTCGAGQTAKDGSCVPKTCQADGYGCPTCNSDETLIYLEDQSGFCKLTSCPESQNWIDINQTDAMCVDKTCQADGYGCPTCNSDETLMYFDDGSGFCKLSSCPESQKLVDINQTHAVCVNKTCQADGYGCPTCNAYQTLSYNADGSGYCLQTSCPEGLFLQNGTCVEKSCDAFNNGCYSGCLCRLPLYGTEYPLDRLEIEYCSVVLDNEQKIDFTLNVGSGLAASQSEPNLLYALTDKGPVMRCGDTQKIALKTICPADASADDIVMLKPNFVPSIFVFDLDLDQKQTQLRSILPLMDQGGKVLSGRSHPKLAVHQRAFDVMGNEVAYDPDGIDPRGIVRMSDGTFWVSDASVASILHVNADGKSLKRLVPAGMQNDFNASRCPVQDVLPSELSTVAPNQGLHGITANTAENMLYFVSRTPLFIDKNTSGTSRYLRLYEMPIQNPQGASSYLYRLDDADAGVVELSLSPEGDLLVMERLLASTRIYKTALQESAKITSGADLNKITPMAKTLLFDSATATEVFPSTLEGMTRIWNGSYLLINNNGYHLEGETTILKTITLTTGGAQ